jgi:hypothetical protein
MLRASVGWHKPDRRPAAALRSAFATGPRLAGYCHVHPISRQLASSVTVAHDATATPEHAICQEQSSWLVQENSSVMSEQSVETPEQSIPTLS